MEAAKYWTVIDAEAGVLSLSYEFADAASSNCFTARLPSGGVLIVSPPTKISGAALDELRRFGQIEALVANNGFHHLGLPTWQARFPKARSFAAKGAIERIVKKNPEVGELLPLSMLQPELGEDIAVVEAPGGKLGETWARAKITDGYAWYASDMLVNMQKLPAKFFARLLFKLTKSGPGYRTFNLANRFMLRDKRAAFQAMLDDLSEHPPSVVIPAHGEILRGAQLAETTRRLLESAL